MAEVNIYFGSQSGTAESFSEEIKEEAAEHGINAQVIDLMLFTPQDFATCKIAVMVVSTYGDGEPTDNAVAFHRWASDPRNDPGAPLKGMRYAVMGLGDMNYSKFNNMGGMTDQNLERLGAKRIYRRGVGDDSQDIAEDFVCWKSEGLWASLKKAIAEVRLEPKDLVAVAADVGPVAAIELKPELHVFYAQEEDDGAAKDLCDAFNECCNKAKIEITLVTSLTERKAVEAVKKIPKRAIVVVICDVGPDGMCSSGRKIIRNMSLELDTGSLDAKDLRLFSLTVATSKCNTSANSLKAELIKNGEGIAKAFEKAGAKVPEESYCGYVDAGVEDAQAVIGQVCAAVAKQIERGTITIGGSATPAAAPAAAAQKASLAAQKTRIFYAGAEAMEAAEALAASWKCGTVTVEEASLGALANAAQQKAQAVVAVECAFDGNLSDAGRGLATQLGVAPIAIKAQLRTLRFALLAVAATDFGNAGERASAAGMLGELTRAAAPVSKALTSAGAGCVASESLDLQEADESKLAELSETLQKGFTALAAKSAAVKPVQGYPAAGAVVAAFGTPVLKMAAPGSTMPTEGEGEPSDVVARFYFEANQAKVVKVRELRQQPNAENGLSTVEVEIEAAGGLKGYALGGTLSLLPQNDPADVAAVVKLMGLKEADLARPITFAAAEGPTMRVKRPFPTPCTLGDALSRYCDLGRAPNKKMLTALQAGIADPTARECVTKLISDPEALKALQAAPLCCKMHEFWDMLGVTTGIDPGAFLLHCPRQKPREFTIASSPKASPDRISLCVSLTSHESTDFTAVAEHLARSGCVPSSSSCSRGKFFGMASRWLSTRLKPGDMVLARQRTSPLTLPAKDVPIIMIGAGAGVAPFRGFWDEIRRGPQTAPAALFFGCRHAEQDWLYKDEMNGAVKLGKAGAGQGAALLAKVQVGPKRPLTCLFTAFSQPGEGKQKNYVQDMLRAQKASVKHWVEKMGGSVFICGSSAMGNSVLDVLADILEGGRETVDTLRKDGRVVAEMWG